MKAITVDDLTSRVSKSVIILCTLLCAVAVFIVVAVVAYQASKNAEFDLACRSEALKWNQEWSKHKANAQDPSHIDHLAVELARARSACPNGHSLIDERRIPANVIELSKEERIIDSARRQLTNQMR